MCGWFRLEMAISNAIDYTFCRIRRERPTAIE
jgi:hypothetical protein